MLNIDMNFPGYIPPKPGERCPEIRSEGYSLALDFDGDPKPSSILKAEDNSFVKEDLPKMKAGSIIRGKRYFKAQQSHIFMNWDLYEVKNLQFMYPGEKVHIFIDKLMDSFYNYDDYMYWFIDNTNAITGNKTIIHIPYYAFELRYSLEAKLDRSNYYIIRMEHKDVNFRFRRNLDAVMDSFLNIVIPQRRDFNKEIIATTFWKKIH